MEDDHILNAAFNYLIDTLETTESYKIYKKCCTELIENFIGSINVAAKDQRLIDN